MNGLKRLIRRLGGETLQNLIVWLLIKLRLNDKFILFSAKKARLNEVNINYWADAKNLGDAIAPVIVNYVARSKGIDINKKIAKTRHLYAVGSVITAGCQNCTIWGSGILNAKILYRLKNRKLDVRSVRDPITRMLLMEYGHAVPEVYGDPAILMPLIYNPEVEKKHKVSVITHMNEESFSQYHQISIITDDYEAFVREIKASELIVSSSLHGVIFAEAYGVPAILLQPKMDMLKYYDYYYGTGRYCFPICQNVDEAETISPPIIPDFASMQEAIMEAFPGDLWDDRTRR